MNTAYRTHRLASATLFGILVMLTGFMALQVYAQSAISHLRERVFYVDASGIIGQTADVRSQIGDSAASHYVWGMKPIVVHRGKFYHVFIDASEGGDSDVYLRTSADGIHWNEKVRVSDDSLDAPQRHPAIAVYGSDSTLRIVVVWSDYRTPNPQLRAAVSTDGGQSWSPSVQISHHTDNSYIWGNIAVGPEGTFYVCWQRQYSFDRRDDVFFSKSVDGGLTWSADTIAYDGHHYTGYSQIVAGDTGRVFILIDDDQYFKRNLVLRYSNNFGNNWQTGTQPTNYSLYEGSYVPSMAIEGDTLYVIYKYFRSFSDSSRFYFLKSTDAGITWSQAVQVNDSLTIDDDNNPGYSRFYPSIAVAPGGQRIYAVWADRRENPSQQEYNVYFSFSLDGGQTWSSDIQVNEDTSGSYQLYPAVAVKSDGVVDTVLVVWEDDRPGTIVGIESGVQKPDAFLLHQNYPNPFNPGTQITFALPEAAVVTLKVYDLLGREVKTLVNQRRAAGTHTVRWDGTDEAGNPVASGVYLYRLHVGNNFVQTRKMVLLK